MSGDTTRPDFVEVTGSASADFDELKLLSPTGIIQMGLDIGFYTLRLSAAMPGIPIGLGTGWLPGFTEWPSFASPLVNPGDTLITVTPFPGAIFYFFLPRPSIPQMLPLLIPTISSGSQGLAGVANMLDNSEKLASLQQAARVGSEEVSAGETDEECQDAAIDLEEVA